MSPHNIDFSGRIIFTAKRDDILIPSAEKDKKC
jgi:hypothetical protein